MSGKGQFNVTDDDRIFEFQSWDYDNNAPIYESRSKSISLTRYFYAANINNIDDKMQLFNISSSELLADCVNDDVDGDKYDELLKPLPYVSPDCGSFIPGRISIDYCTSSPTINPTIIFTTVEPSIDPTKAPSNEPTQSYSSSTDDNLASSTSVFISTTNERIEVESRSRSELADDLNQQFEEALIGLLSIFLLIIISGYIHAKFIKINHYFYVGPLVNAAINVLDMLSDIFFAAQAEIFIDYKPPQTQIIFISSILFVIIPILFSIWQLYNQMHKHWLNNDRLRAWLSHKTKLLFLVSVISGSSFSAIDLFNSNLFSHPTFDMGLTKHDYIGFKYKRVYSIVLLENCPQLIIQIWYIAATDGFYNAITLASLTFTSISILVSIMSMCVTKQIIYDQDVVTIEYEVTGKVIVSKLKHTNRAWKLHEQLASILGINKDLIDLERPQIGIEYING